MQKLSEAWSWIADDLREEGRVEGLKEAYAEGFNEAYAEGINEVREKIAKNLIKEGMTVQKISAITDLSIEQVERIRDSS